MNDEAEQPYPFFDHLKFSSIDGRHEGVAVEMRENFGIIDTIAGGVFQPLFERGFTANQKYLINVLLLDTLFQSIINGVGHSDGLR